jgi:hypothetical protein
MAYPALELINRAYYLSQVVARDFQTVTASQQSDGLYLLNALLDFKGTDLRLIPYFTHYEFDTTYNTMTGLGTEKYYIPNLLYVDTLTFNIGPVRYPMRSLSREEYFATGRVDDISNLSFSYRCERVLGGMDIYLYFLPGGVYRMKMEGKFGLTEVTLQTDLSLVYDKYYIEYLRYALAEYICSEYGATFPDESKRKLAEFVKKLMDVSPADLTLKKQSSFRGQPALDWQTINLGKGWFPF